MSTDYFVHESSFVDEGAVIGEGTSIWHFCHVFPGAQIGKDCKIGQNVVIHSSAKIGNNVKIQNNVSIYDGVVLEDNVFCGPSCVFTNIMNPRSAVPKNSAEHYRKTLVKDGVSIGANTTIVCGVTIGRSAFIGAGSVVTKDVKAYELAYGSPARHKGWICSCGEKIEFNAEQTQCSACQTSYTLKDQKVERLS